MYGYEEAATLLHRELVVQNKLALVGAPQVLHIPATFGPVGGGKSAMHVEEAIWWDKTFCVFNSGENSDATDLSGVCMPTMIGNLFDTLQDPTINTATRNDARGKYMQWVLNKYAALACIQAVYLFFDDLDKAPPPIQAALLAIFADRRFRDQPLHPGTLIACAGNRTEDDETAYALSESTRTRLTMIPMSPDLLSWTKYATKNNLNASIIGFLQYKGEFLHQWKDGVYRFPTPRGWWEVSQMMEQFPDPYEDVLKNGRKDNWKQIVSLKCGDHVANDYWAWFKILSVLKPETILSTGAIPYDKMSASTEADRRMTQYAAVFSVTQHLVTKGVQSKHKGLQKFLKDLTPEMRVAFVVQLPLKVRVQAGKLFPKTGDIMMSDIVRTTKGPTLQPSATAA